jgi:hypothetical protein
MVLCILRSCVLCWLFYPMNWSEVQNLQYLSNPLTTLLTCSYSDGHVVTFVCGTRSNPWCRWFLVVTVDQRWYYFSGRDSNAQLEQGMRRHTFSSLHWYLLHEVWLVRITDDNWIRAVCVVSTVTDRLKKKVFRWAGKGKYFVFSFEDSLWHFLIYIV